MKISDSIKAYFACRFFSYIRVKSPAIHRLLGMICLFSMLGSVIGGFMIIGSGKTMGGKSLSYFGTLFFAWWLLCVSDMQYRKSSRVDVTSLCYLIRHHFNASSNGFVLRAGSEQDCRSVLGRCGTAVVDNIVHKLRGISATFKAKSRDLAVFSTLVILDVLRYFLFEANLISKCSVRV
jgi:hypothetical protein